MSCLPDADLSPFDNYSALGVEFSWTEKSGCSPVSPPIVVTSVPAETFFLNVRMVDLNVPDYMHGGGEVNHDGSGLIPEGALGNYAGPCPPGGQHTYRFTVQALNADKSLVLGVGESERLFPE